MSSQVKLPANKVLENKKNVLENALRGGAGAADLSMNNMPTTGTSVGVKFAPKFPLKKQPTSLLTQFSKLPITE